MYFKLTKKSILTNLSPIDSDGQDKPSVQNMTAGLQSAERRYNRHKHALLC